MAGWQGLNSRHSVLEKLLITPKSSPIPINPSKTAYNKPRNKSFCLVLFGMFATKTFEILQQKSFGHLTIKTLENHLFFYCFF